MTTNIPAGWAIEPTELPHVIAVAAPNGARWRVLRDSNPSDGPAQCLAALAVALLDATPPVDAVPGEPMATIKGFDPLDPTKGAHLPMVPSSWRFGFWRANGGLEFRRLDEGAFVAWDAVKDAVWASIAKPGDWAEDFDHENGQYSCACIECKRVFTGHKRRVVCKLCATPTAPQAVGEPVAPFAYCYAFHGGINRHLSFTRWTGPQRTSHIETPLYDHAAPVAPRAGEEVAQALRMAVDRHMTCRFYFGSAVAQATVPGGPAVYETVENHVDPLAGACQAIARAAAKIDAGIATHPAPAKGEEAVAAFATREILSELNAIDTAVTHWIEDKQPRSQLLRSITDGIRSLLATTAPTAAAEPRGTLTFIDAADWLEQESIRVYGQCLDDHAEAANWLREHDTREAAPGAEADPFLQTR